NQAETELLAKQLAEAGYWLVPSADKADIYILNTCTVTHIADRKSPGAGGRTALTWLHQSQLKCAPVTLLD
ncbi:unnamed protein product, partial [marine sediment metagenome]